MYTDGGSAEVSGDRISTSGENSEGCLSFDPSNRAQSKLAIKIAGARPNRTMSPEQLARLAEMRLKIARPLVEGHLAAQERFPSLEPSNKVTSALHSVLMAPSTG
jgi:hypothetical protein